MQWWRGGEGEGEAGGGGSGWSRTVGSVCKNRLVPIASRNATVPIMVFPLKWGAVLYNFDLYHLLVFRPLQL